MFEHDIRLRAERVVTLYREKGLTLACAESCTGGLLAGLVTSVPGASDMFDRGFVTYSNDAKVECLGVTPALLDQFGAVSAEVAAAMAAGALAHARAMIALAITGVAGPGGGTAQKPVGLVHFGLGRRDGQVMTVEKRFGDIGRDAVRKAALGVAVDLLLDAAG